MNAPIQVSRESAERVNVALNELVHQPAFLKSVYVAKQCRARSGHKCSDDLCEALAKFGRTLDQASAEAQLNAIVAGKPLGDSS